MAIVGNLTTVDIIEDNTKLIGEMLVEARNTALARCGKKCLTYAQRLVPVDTGNLLDSLGYYLEIGGMDPCVHIGTNVEYAGYVELGTSRNKAQPYLTPAANNHKSEYQSIFDSTYRSFGS